MCFNMTGCVPREVLCALLEEQLDDATRDEVEDHVERCLFCQQRLEELTRRCEFLWLGATLPQSWSVHEAHPSGDQTGGPASNGEMPSTVHLHELNESCSEPELSDEFGPPPQVEGYELISLLGHGGMGVVYKARHRRLGRMVALKMIRPGGGTRLDHLARLRDEAQTLAPGGSSSGPPFGPDGDGEPCTPPPFHRAPAG
jgi:hypothetical protein